MPTTVRVFITMLVAMLIVAAAGDVRAGDLPAQAGPTMPVAAPALPVAGRGGHLLPPGYLGTSGSQIVDAGGTPVRIASIGWNGPDDLGLTPHGLNRTGYRTIIDAVKADGFNTIRIPWSDRLIGAAPVAGAIDSVYNPDLRGLDALQVLDRIVAYAGQVGLKIILDHHNNEGGAHGWGGTQGNGLWFDSGPGSDGTDGSGNRGTVTAARFRQNWLALTQRYAGNPTVIGFDLTNEPTSYWGKSSWGDGGTNDIRAMYQHVGNAVQAIDPGALIIAEGPSNYHGSFAGRGAAPEGDLTLAESRPVVLRLPGKVVYSVHLYPAEVNDVRPDTGPAVVARMNAAWGYLVTRGIAPVWIGEMGACMDSPEDAAWAQTLLDYMAGRLGAQHGPTFAGNQQPISGSWWLVGEASGQQPNGIQYAWGAGNYRPEQQAVTDRMLFRP